MSKQQKERVFAVLVTGDGGHASGVVPRSRLREVLRSAFYNGDAVPAGQEETEEARWKHISSASNWTVRDPAGGPVYYEYFDGEATLRAFVVPG